jgi:isopentenyl diphosphate isomerase/L-lactate dehydrogenase-like FMN-dependent dehydrogenase
MTIRRADARVAAKIDSVTTAEYYARKRLPESFAQLLEGGSGTGRALEQNVAAFERITFRPRTAVSHQLRGLSTTVLGNEISMPVILAPTGNLRVFHRDAEAGVARAAAAARTIMCVPTVTSTAIEELAGSIFFQLYYFGARNSAEEMIERARAAGARALIVTVDTPTLIPRERAVPDRRYLPLAADLRNATRFLPQMASRPRWTFDFVRDRRRNQAAMGRAQSGRLLTSVEARASVTSGDIPVWDDIPWIRERWDGPIVIKGILTPDDARRALDVGADAIVVSNHGGSLFDGVPATMDVLADIVDAVGSNGEVLVDSGVRRGTDVVRALALGARAVLIGRGFLWAHAAAGQAGVERILEVFREEIDRTLMLIGCPSVGALDRSYVGERRR